MQRRKKEPDGIERFSTMIRSSLHPKRHPTASYAERLGVTSDLNAVTPHNIADLVRKDRVESEPTIKSVLRGRTSIGGRDQRGADLESIITMHVTDTNLPRKRTRQLREHIDNKFKEYNADIQTTGKNFIMFGYTKVDERKVLQQLFGAEDGIL